MNLHKFQIQYLRQKNLQALMEALVVMIGAIFVAILLPQVLVRFIYANQQLTAEPMLLQYIPVVALVLGVLQLVVTLLGNFLRERQMVKLERTLVNEVNQSTGAIDESELKELEKLVDSALTKHSPKKVVKKSATTNKSTTKPVARTKKVSK
ncbi:hypothetical protein KBC89_03660 [Candidatus Woesebacteria bacterium]|nr:hypothetical protein [Candidatus Woesebacteria bacterium]